MKKSAEPEIAPQDIEEFVENPCYAFVLERLKEIRDVDTALSTDMTNSNDVMRSAIAHGQGIDQLVDIIADLETRIEFDDRQRRRARSEQPEVPQAIEDLGMQIRRAHQLAGGRRHGGNGRG